MQLDVLVHIGDGQVTWLCRLVVIHFWASWSEPCQQMQDVMLDLAKEHKKVKFYKVHDWCDTVCSGWPAMPQGPSLA